MEARLGSPARFVGELTLNPFLTVLALLSNFCAPEYCVVILFTCVVLYVLPPLRFLPVMALCTEGPLGMTSLGRFYSRHGEGSSWWRREP